MSDTSRLAVVIALAGLFTGCAEPESLPPPAVAPDAPAPAPPPPPPPLPAPAPVALKGAGPPKPRPPARQDDARIRELEARAAGRAKHETPAAPPATPPVDPASDADKATYAVVRAVRLHCLNAVDGDGLFATDAEEPSLFVGKRPIFHGEDFKKDTWRDLSAETAFRGKAELRLIERDVFVNDPIGSVAVDSTVHGETEVELKNQDGSRYRLTYRVEPPRLRCARLRVVSLRVVKPFFDGEGEQESCTLRAAGEPLGATEMPRDAAVVFSGSIDLEVHLLRTKTHDAAKRPRGPHDSPFATSGTQRVSASAARGVPAEVRFVVERPSKRGEYVLAYELLD